MKKIKKTKKGTPMGQALWLFGKQRKVNYKLVKIIGSLVLTLLFAFGIYYIYTYIPGVKEAVSLATTVKPETFTELYFENHLQLPPAVVLNQENKFSFTLHNLEYQDMTYPYEVYISCLNPGCNGDKQLIDKGTVALHQDEYKTVPESFTLTLPTGRVQVIANLIDKNQQIDFWVNGTTATPQPVLAAKTIQPIALTDLYFSKNPPLPYWVTQNQVMSFAFTIHNNKNTDFTYPYVVYMEENGRVNQIAEGQITLKQGEYKTVTKSYTITATVRQAQIFVKLTNENRYIYFKIKGTQ